MACAILLAGAACTVPGRGSPDKTDLEQGWTGRQLADWYGGDQGSRLIPKVWFLALEQPDGGGLFLDKAYMQRFGFLPQPGALPIGFTIDIQDDTELNHTRLRWPPGQGLKAPWVGMTCAACHTADLTWRGHSRRVEGGASLIDFQSFEAAFTGALRQTVQDPAKFKRFADRVLGAGASDVNRQTLHAALASLSDYHGTIAGMNETQSEYGFGRLDAIGHIFNKVAFVANQGAAQQNRNEPDAPVSYPFLWNLGQQSQVEWNGMAAAHRWPGLTSQVFDLGALGRNMGEVTGVYGDVTAPHGTVKTYQASQQISSLVAIEQQIDQLKPPRWPRDLFPIDTAKAAHGKALYGQYCAACHYEVKRDDLKTRVRAGGAGPLDCMSYFADDLLPANPESGARDCRTYLPAAQQGPLASTDRLMACNAVLDEAQTGAMEGQRLGAPGHETLGAREPVSAMLVSMVSAILTERKGQILVNAAQSAIGIHPPPRVFAHAVMSAMTPPSAAELRRRMLQARLRACQPKISAGDLTLGYRARPLSGVWATAPYLHNGSVPTLYDLLLPPDRRPRSFYVGSREFDPDKVGYVTTAGRQSSLFRVMDDEGKVIIGNSNEGHDYLPASVSEADRRALLEYLKILGE
ncbi:di-heme-cytochrome C peroxidase [Phenylobacterium sp.]|uniref:di-heme-cytochrome C peroxidase n=1 Tax=Phenylobacterium sp. TaxID=1871053 RepID=UPI002DEE82D4|nr:di-heme-cytochrome C peroxidase [Phenylobacterium sp.]